MGQHTVEIGVQPQKDAPATFFYRCRCGAAGQGLRTRQMAEDGMTAHLRYVERVRTTLAAKGGTLDQAYRHYREMADNPEVSEHDRAQWRALADEAGQRLGLNAPKAVDEPLFTL